MTDSLQAHVEAHRKQVAALAQRGLQLRERLAKEPSNPSAIAATRVWQEHCGVLINQLSGGSKAHWLARAFSEAFLMRSAAGEAVEVAAPEQIVQRLLDVLEQARGALTGKENGPAFAMGSEPATHRFDFVHNAELRPILEQAYTEARQALEQREYELALRTSCGILEAIVTDALEHKGTETLFVFDAPTSKIADWPFETRLAVAEKAGLIRSGCARLPADARAYRDHHGDGDASNANISERDAQVTGQVLRVIMRDLNPGR
jgi:hypothetical protein